MLIICASMMKCYPKNFKKREDTSIRKVLSCAWWGGEGDV